MNRNFPQPPYCFVSFPLLVYYPGTEMQHNGIAAKRLKKRKKEGVL
jgi:hypothetical protein